MNTYTPYSEVQESFTYPNTPDSGTLSAVVTHDFGDTIVDVVPVLDTGDTYIVDIDPELINAAGIYQIKWGCEFSGSTFYGYSNFSVEDQYITEDLFLDLYPEFNSAEYLGDSFKKEEKIARLIIDTFCGQYFQYVNNKTLTFDGNGRDKLYLGLRLNSINEVEISDFESSDDYTSTVEVDPSSRYFLRIRRSDSISYSRFPENTTISVKGDWGWLYVPSNIQQATGMLVADLFEDVKRQHKRYAIVRHWQDTQRFEFNAESLSTTGNTDVDVLLMDYVYWTIDYIG